ncbi:caspase family protein [Spirosoma arcticum]
MRKLFCGCACVSALRPAFCCWLILLSLSSAVYAQTAQEWTNRADAEPDPARAEQFYTEALRLNPSADAVLLGRAIVRGRLGRYQEGISDASAAIALSDQQPLYYAQRAYLRLQLSEYDDAASDYQQALRFDPRDARYYSGLSNCRLKQNRLPEAFALAQKGIELTPDSPYPYRNRGRAQLYSGKTNEAIADFQRSLDRRHAESYRVLTDLGEAYERKREYTKSADYYKQALVLKPGYVDAEVRLLGLTKNGWLKATTVVPGAQPTSSAAGSPTFAGKRVALVIGNSEYLTIDPHLNGQPEQDAQAIDARLKELGFTSIISLNTDAKTLHDQLNAFYEVATGADLVFFYFAGHGLQYNGSNYLLPVDIELFPNDPASYAGKLNRQALLITTVIERLQKCRPQFCVIVLDACREDPLRTSKTAPAGDAGAGSHLTPQPFVPIVVENFIRNCCVAQATAAGSRAWNGPGRNGCYTEALLRHLNRGNSLGAALKRVRSDVLDASKKAGTEQRPEFLDQTTDDLIF